MLNLTKLINPPIQPLLWGSGMVMLALGTWSILSLKMLDENGANQAADISVKIPDASVLDTPNLNAYPQMVQAPLFWESRKLFVPEPVTPEPQIVTPVDTTLPQGRLIGIIDVEGSLFGIMENAAGGSVRLRVGDSWGAWKVTGIDPDRLLLEVGNQRQDIPLVADFAAPQENPQVVQARAAAAQQKAHQQAQRQQQAMPAGQPQPFANAAAPAATAGLPFPADAEKQPPALSVNEALEARQRLMAARWGALTGGDAAAAQPPTGQ